MQTETRSQTREYLASITLDEGSIIRRAPEIESERAAAIADLLVKNHFNPLCVEEGPYDVFLSVRDNRLRFAITSPTITDAREVVLPIAPFRRVIKDYFLMCEGYFKAMHTAEPHKLEALDMGRRGIHNEGSELLQEQLNGRIALDFDTARRLFTLICVLHIK